MPYLTPEVAAVPFAIKERPEDFVVEEIPLYEPCGSGEHTFVAIEKREMGTLEALGVFAAKFGLVSREIGCAGLKDSRGITRQTLSLPGVDPQRALDVQGPRLRVLAAVRHVNKLRVGQLAGNRFDLRLRGLARERFADLERVLEVLRARGVPNYFGEQRFGARGDSWSVGRDLLRGAYEDAFAQFCGRPTAQDHGRVLDARRLYDEGKFRAAGKAWPRGFHEQIRVCEAMAKNKGRAQYAVRALNLRLGRFYVSAWQSRLFNAVLAARLDSFDRVLEGDLAWKHDNGAVFLVGDPEREAARAAACELSPTGPLFGERMSEPRGRPAEVEAEALAHCGATREEFERESWFRPSGGRRPLRFPFAEYAASWETDDAGAHARVRFTLPKGCYATVVLREVGKQAMVHTGITPAAADDDEPE
ncbi:MAG: tRNA pseudouridine(13) synthase TruD [Planctomycetota bacterium]|nr:MAG: tRNA pseudouridine(13) synthase TruD [Planctomycetota bacterium]